MKQHSSIAYDDKISMFRNCQVSTWNLPKYPLTRAGSERLIQQQKFERSCTDQLESLHSLQPSQMHTYVKKPINMPQSYILLIQ